MVISWKEKKNRICKLIKLISDYHGGDDIDWLRDYCKEVIAKHHDNLDSPLAMFLEMANSLELDVVEAFAPTISGIIASNVCNECNFVQTFCRCN